MNAPVKPNSGNWKRVRSPEGETYVSPMGLVVISSVHLIEGRMEYHLSISDRGRRIALSLIEPVLRMFGAEKWNEDNHVYGGQARHYWCPVDRPPEICPCQANEKPTIEGDYVVRDE